MNTSRSFAPQLVGLALFAGAIICGSVAVAERPGFGCGPEFCLDVWDPVICDDGRVYSNDCYAARACATGCQPYGDW